MNQWERAEDYSTWSIDFSMNQVALQRQASAEVLASVCPAETFANLPLLYNNDKVAKLVSDTPAGRARPAPRAYRAKKGHQGHESLGGLQSTH